MDVFESIPKHSRMVKVQNCDFSISVAFLVVRTGFPNGGGEMYCCYHSTRIPLNFNENELCTFSVFIAFPSPIRHTSLTPCVWVMSWVMSGGQWLVCVSWLLLCELIAFQSGGQRLACVGWLLLCQEANGVSRCCSLRRPMVWFLFFHEING